MKTIITFSQKIIVTSILLLASHSAFSQGWFVNNTFNPAQSLQAIKFYDANTGYTTAPVYGGGSTLEIHKTTNGGQTWVDQSAGFTGERFMAIWIVHPDTVYISGNDGHILKTVNGGQNWINMRTDTLVQLWGLQFVNSFTGYAAGSMGIIIKTTNAGVTWTPLTSGVQNALSCMHFRNENTGYISGSGIILKTTNAGATWVSQSAAFINFENLRDITFTDDNNGFAVSDADRIFKTTNGGANWAISLGGSGQSLFGIYFTDPNTAYACGFNGAIIRTTNAGANWTSQTSPTTQILTDIWFTTATTGYISTWSGQVLKTTNGGVTFVQPIGSEVPKNFSLSQNYPNPFNPSTNIEFSVPASVGNAYMRSVQLKIYDAAGNEITTLVNDNLTPGVYRVQWNASGYASGVYFYKLVADEYNETKRMVLVK